jgi:hypothetical protein
VKPQNKKKHEAPKFNKRGSESRAANKIFCSFGQQVPKSDHEAKNHRVQKISKFAVNCFKNTKRLLNFVEGGRGLYGRYHV